MRLFIFYIYYLNTIYSTYIKVKMCHILAMAFHFRQISYTWLILIHIHTCVHIFS